MAVEAREVYLLLNYYYQQPSHLATRKKFTGITNRAGNFKILTIVGSYSSAMAPCAFVRSCFFVGSRYIFSVGSPSLRMSHHST